MINITEIAATYFDSSPEGESNDTEDLPVNTTKIGVYIVAGQCIYNIK